MKSYHLKENPYLDFIISRFFLLAIISVSFSCNKTPTCELDNSGTIIVENTSANGTLHIFFNNNRPSVNGPGDLIIQPGEKGSLILSAGQHNVKAATRVTTCNNNRCSTKSNGKPERTIDLFSCQDVNLVY